ncbi:MAG: hypothetical protein ACE10G_09450, partial [Gemmatimonadales bacterium]
MREPTLGDLAEGFIHMLRQHDRVAAETWYWRQVRGSLNPMIRWSFGFDLFRRKGTWAGTRLRGNIMQSILQDIRYGLRAAVKNLGFTVVVVMTLGLGIGANTAIFSVVDGILLRPLPYPDPEQLVTVWADYSVRSGRLREWLSYPNFHDLRQEADAFEEAGVWSDWNPTLTGLGSAELVT